MHLHPARLFALVAIFIIACGFRALTEFGPASNARPVAELKTRDAIILRLVEDITKYLPISSTRHLIIATSAPGLENDMPLTDFTGALAAYFLF